MSGEVLAIALEFMGIVLWEWHALHYMGACVDELLYLISPDLALFPLDNTGYQRNYCYY